MMYGSYNKAFPNSFELFPSKLISFSVSSFNKMSLSIVINKSPSSLSCNIEERSLVFTRFNVENDRSAELEVIGIAKAIA